MYMRNFFKLLSLATIITIGCISTFANTIANKNSTIAVVVNKHVITERDVKQRINFALFSTGMEDTKNNREMIRKQVIGNMIDEKLYLDAAKKIKVEVSKKEIDTALENMAKNNGMTKAKMVELFANNNVPIKVIETSAKASIARQKFIEKRFGFLVQIPDDEIEREHKAYKAKLNKTRFDLMEIFIAARGSNANNAKKRADYVCEQLKQGTRFDALARQFSDAQTAKNGGNMETVYSGDLHPKIEKALMQMPVGDVCMPIRTHAGFHIYLLRGRTLNGKPDLMKADIKFVQAVIPASQHMNDNEASQAMEKVEQFKRCKSCSELKELAAKQGCQYAESPDAMKFGQFSPQIRSLMLYGGVSEPPVNKCLEPAMTPEGLIITMVCSLKHNKERVLTKNDIALNIQYRRLNDYAERKLQRDRSTAYIRCEAGEGYENCR